MMGRRTDLGSLAKGVVGPRWIQTRDLGQCNHALLHLSILQTDYTWLSPYWSLASDLGLPQSVPHEAGCEVRSHTPWLIWLVTLPS